MTELIVKIKWRGHVTTYAKGIETQRYLFTNEQDAKTAQELLIRITAPFQDEQVCTSRLEDSGALQAVGDEADILLT